MVEHRQQPLRRGRLIVLGALVLLGLPGIALAQTTTGPAVEPDVYYPSNSPEAPGNAAGEVQASQGNPFGRWLVLTGILAMAGVGFWLVSARRGHNPWAKLMGQKGSAIRIDELRALGQRQFLAIVTVEGQRLLLATGPQGTTLLKELDGPEFAADLDASPPEDLP